MDVTKYLEHSPNSGQDPRCLKKLSSWFMDWLFGRLAGSIPRTGAIQLTAQRVLCFRVAEINDDDDNESQSCNCPFYALLSERNTGRIQMLQSKLCNSEQFNFSTHVTSSAPLLFDTHTNTLMHRFWSSLVWSNSVNNRSIWSSRQILLIWKSNWPRNHIKFPRLLPNSVHYRNFPWTERAQLPHAKSVSQLK